MNFSIKNILPLLILFFTCSFLHGAETAEEDLYPIKYQFYQNDDCIKVKITHPEGIKAKSTLYKIKNPSSKGVTVQIKNAQLKCLETFFQVVNIEVHAVQSREEGGVTFKIIENLERKPTNKELLTDKITNSTTYFVKTDKQVDIRNDIIPKLTGSGNSPHIQYVRFFTK